MSAETLGKMFNSRQIRLHSQIKQRPNAGKRKKLWGMADLICSPSLSLPSPFSVLYLTLLCCVQARSQLKSAHACFFPSQKKLSSCCPLPPLMVPFFLHYFFNPLLCKLALKKWLHEAHSLWEGWDPTNESRKKITSWCFCSREESGAQKAMGEAPWTINVSWLKYAWCVKRRKWKQIMSNSWEQIHGLAPETMPKRNAWILGERIRKVTEVEQTKSILENWIS